MTATENNNTILVVTPMIRYNFLELVLGISDLDAEERKDIKVMFDSLPRCATMNIYRLFVEMLQDHIPQIAEMHDLQKYTLGGLIDKIVNGKYTLASLKTGSQIAVDKLLGTEANEETRTRVSSALLVISMGAFIGLSIDDKLMNKPAEIKEHNVAELLQLVLRHSVVTNVK